MIQLLSEETHPNPGELLAEFKKAAFNAVSKNLPHAKISNSHADISTWRNLFHFYVTESFNHKVKEIG